MVFYVGNMIKELNNPTVIVVTDRNDLDNQLFETFAKCSDFLRQTPIQIESRRDLKAQLDGKVAGGIIFTTLQKFEEETGLLSERKDILVVADEAHRSHYGIDAVMKFDMAKFEAVKNMVLQNIYMMHCQMQPILDLLELLLKQKIIQQQMCLEKLLMCMI